MRVQTEPREYSLSRAHLRAYSREAESDILRYYGSQHHLETADDYRAHIGVHAVKLAKRMRQQYKHPIIQTLTRSAVELEGTYVGGDSMRYSTFTPPDPNTVTTLPMLERQTRYVSPYTQWEMTRQALLRDYYLCRTPLRPKDGKTKLTINHVEDNDEPFDDRHDTSYWVSVDRDGTTAVDTSAAMDRRLGFEAYDTPVMSADFPRSALAHEQPVVTGTLDDPETLRPALAAVLLVREAFGQKVLDV